MTPRERSAPDFRFSKVSEVETSIQRLAARMALLGGSVSPTRHDGQFVPYCDDPVKVHRWLKSRPDVRGLEVNLLAPCRRCAKCLQLRQMTWRLRALREMASANRTWFGTLTFDDIMLAGMLSQAAVWMKTDRDAPSDEVAEDHNRSLERAGYRHVMGFFKRLRKLKRPFRYMCVFEFGETTGRGHFHLFLHEKGAPILKQWLEDYWRAISHWRLVDVTRPGLAAYVTKYSTKNSACRFRASQGYGDLLHSRPPTVKKGPGPAGMRGGGTSSARSQGLIQP